MPQSNNRAGAQSFPRRSVFDAGPADYSFFILLPIQPPRGRVAARLLIAAPSRRVDDAVNQAACQNDWSSDLHDGQERDGVFGLRHNGIFRVQTSGQSSPARLTQERGWKVGDGERVGSDAALDRSPRRSPLLTTGRPGEGVTEASAPWGSKGAQWGLQGKPQGV